MQRHRHMHGGKRRVETTPEGKVIERLDNGNTLEDLGDGRTKEVFPDGGSVIHNPRALERQLGIERIDLNQYEFVWMRNFDRNPKGESHHDWEICKEFRLLVKRVRISHKRAQRLKSEVGRLRGTLAQHEQQRSNAPSVAALDFKPSASDLGALQARGQAGERRYNYEIRRSELVLAQHVFADAIECLGKFIDHHGLGTDEAGNQHPVPVTQQQANGATYRLFLHNLGQALLLLQAARKACGKIKAYLDQIPEFEAEILRRFKTVVESDYSQFITDHPLGHGPNKNPVRDLRVPRYGSPSPDLNDPILSGAYRGS